MSVRAAQPRDHASITHSDFLLLKYLDAPRDDVAELVDLYESVGGLIEERFAEGRHWHAILQGIGTPVVPLLLELLPLKLSASADLVAAPHPLHGPQPELALGQAREAALNAADLISGFGDEANEVLSAALLQPNAGVRAAAAWLSASTGRAEQLSAALSALLDDHDSTVAGIAGSALLAGLQGDHSLRHVATERASGLASESKRTIRPLGIELPDDEVADTAGELLRVAPLLIGLRYPAVIASFHASRRTAWSERPWSEPEGGDTFAAPSDVRSSNGLYVWVGDSWRSDPAAFAALRSGAPTPLGPSGIQSPRKPSGPALTDEAIPMTSEGEALLALVAGLITREDLSLPDARRVIRREVARGLVGRSDSLWIAAASAYAHEADESWSVLGLAQTALEAADAADDAEPQFKGPLLNFLGQAALRIGRQDLARDAFIEAVPLLDASGEAKDATNCCLMLGHAFFELSEFVSAERWIVEAERRVRHEGRLAELPNCDATLAQVRVKQGRHEEALALMRRAQEGFRTAGDPGKALRSVGMEVQPATA